MEKVNEVFFSEKGLTSTSASHLADLAQKTVLGNEAKLKNMSFITTKVDIVGSLSESGKTVSLGYDEKGLSEVKGLLEEIAEMNAFCAWMREAIKAKEREIQQINRCSFDEWCQLFGYPVIEKTELPKEIRAEDLIAEMNVKERNRYFTLEAIAATIGKYIQSRRKVFGCQRRTFNQDDETLYSRWNRKGYLNLLPYSFGKPGEGGRSLL